MKATLVHNIKGEPRVLIELETQEEREALKTLPDLVCVRTGESNGQLADLAYALQRQATDKDEPVTNEIRSWLEEAKAEGATHVIIVCDTFDHSDYPVNVSADEDVRECAKKYDGKNMQRIMEVYSLSRSIDIQLAEGRAFHYD